MQQYDDMPTLEDESDSDQDETPAAAKKAAGASEDLSSVMVSFRGKSLSPADLLERVATLAADPVNTPTVVEGLTQFVRAVRIKFGDAAVVFARCIVTMTEALLSLAMYVVTDQDIELIKRAVTNFSNHLGATDDETVNALLKQGMLLLRHQSRKAEAIDVFKQALQALDAEGALQRCKAAAPAKGFVVGFSAATFGRDVPLACHRVAADLMARLKEQPQGKQDQKLFANILAQYTLALSFRRLLKGSGAAELVTTLYALGSAMFHNAKFEGAERYLREAHDMLLTAAKKRALIHPEDAYASQLLAKTYQALGREFDAQEVLRDYQTVVDFLASSGAAASSLHTLELLQAQVWRLKDYGKAVVTAEHLLRAEIVNPHAAFAARYWYMVAARAAPAAGK